MNHPNHQMPPSVTSEHVYTTPDPLGPPQQEQRTVANGNQIIEFPDGSAFVGPNEDEQALYPDRINPNNHNENLALALSESELREIGYSIRQSVDSDIASQEEFFDSVSELIEYLGIMLDTDTSNDDKTFKGAAGVYDPTLLQTLLEIVINACELIFGEVDTKILGNQTEKSIDIAARKKAFVNNFLDNISKGSMKENYKTLLWAVFAGSAYKKVYRCPIKNLPETFFIPIRDLIVNSSHSSHHFSARKTHILRLDEREFQIHVMMGMYRDVSIAAQTDYEDEQGAIESQLNKISGIESDQSFLNEPGVVLYEAHCDYRIKGDPAADGVDIPLPYRITVDKTSGNVLSVYRNWSEGDYLKKKIEFFVNYSFLPSFKGEGYGMVHYAGKTSRAATVITRQLIDAATKSNFPGGVYQAGIRLENNNLSPDPGEFVPIQTGGLPVDQAIMALPYKEPSQALLALRNELADSIRKPSSIVNEKIIDLAPKTTGGTILALLKNMQSIPNAINYGFFRSRTEELKLINDRFYECLSDSQPYPFLVDGGEHVVIRQDFSPDSNVILIPANDPTLDNSNYRMMQAEIMINNAKENPALHNLKFAYEYLYKTLDFPEDVVKKLLTPDDGNKQEPPPPMDPVSTIMALTKGEPVNAAVWQDHDAYISIIDVWMQTNPEDPNIPAAMALKKQHEAFKYMIDVFAKLNMPPPQDMSQLTPDQQNQLAVEVAQIKLQEAREAAAASQPPEPPLDPAKVELEAAKMEAEVARERNQLEFKKLEVSIKKIQMDYELKVQEFEQKNQLEHIKQELEFKKSELESFKVEHEQALKERDQALKERDSVIDSHKDHQDQSSMQPQVVQHP